MSVTAPRETISCPLREELACKRKRMSSMEQLEAAREVLCLAIGTAEDERKRAVQEHFGGYANLEAERCEKRLRIAATLHEKVDRKLEQVR